MAYIDRDEVLQKMQNWHTRERLIDCVRDMPTADVVEVVRCKDCKHCETNYPEKEPNKEPVMVLFCTRHMCGTLPSEFCSSGKRQEVAE